jgi:hypothetical protein
MIKLVTDRTQHHVDRLKKLQEIGWDNFSESQKEEYRGYAAKGAYNYTDMNRVENAVAEIAPLLNLTLTTRTNWNYWRNWYYDYYYAISGHPVDGWGVYPWEAELDRYLNNVKEIRDACPSDLDFPPLPSNMDCLTYESANNIEKVLEIAYKYLCDTSGVLGKGVLGKMVLGKEL